MQEPDAIGVPPRAWDYCETQAAAGMTSEPPDTGLNSLLSGGKNYERLRLQVIVSNESVAHSRVDAVVSRRSKCWSSWQIELVCYRQTVTRSNFSAGARSAVFMLALHSPVFYWDIVIMN